MSVRRVSIFGFVLSCAVAASAVTTEDLYVAQGATVTRDSTYAGVYNTSLTNSGTLVFSVGGNGTYHFAGKESPAYTDYYTTHLAPNAGDEGVLRVTSGSVGGLVGSNVHGHMYVGDKGGGDKAKFLGF